MRVHCREAGDAAEQVGDALPAARLQKQRGIVQFLRAELNLIRGREEDRRHVEVRQHLVIGGDPFVQGIEVGVHPLKSA